MSLPVHALTCNLCSSAIQTTELLDCAPDGNLVHQECLEKIAVANEKSTVSGSCQRKIETTDIAKLGEDGDLIHQMGERAGIISTKTAN